MRASLASAIAAQPAPPPSALVLRDSYLHPPAQRRVLRRADAGYLLQLRDAREAAVLGAPVDDALRRHGTDARQSLKFGRGRGVDVDDRRRARGAVGRLVGAADNSARGLRRGAGWWGDADEDLLAIDQPTGQVQRRQVGAGDRSAGR